MLEIAQGVTAVGVIFAIAWFWSTLVHPLLGRMLSLVWTAGAASVAWAFTHIGVPLAQVAASGASALTTAVAPARVEVAAPVIETAAELPRVRADGTAEPLSRERQWERVSDVVRDAATRVEAIQGLQRSAEQQLDAATYAVQRLFDELAGIMTVPMQAAEALHDQRPVVVKLYPLGTQTGATGGALAA